MNKRCLLFVVNDPAYFLSHRLAIAVSAQKQGYDVHVATAVGQAVDRIVTVGLKHHVIPVSRSGLNPLKEIRSFSAIWRLMRKLKPSIVHLVTIKPVLYGGVAARLAGVPGVVSAISGLGTVFTARSLRVRILCTGIKIVYRLALGHKNIRVIFQNPGDQTILVKVGAVKPEQTVLVRGSGVKLEDYPVLPEPEGTAVVVFAARLLRDKGVIEFVEAARLMRRRGLETRFQLIGLPDPGNPTTITDTTLSSWKREGLVEVLGYRKDIAALFSLANIVTLPSYYGEGLPKVLIEVAACGRAVITTDHPGCRDAIEPGVTGLLVPARDAVALADAIERLLKDPELRHSMGKAGRELAEREFGIEKVVDAHLRIYQELLDACMSR